MFVLFRFHVRVGARLALRRLAPVAAVFLALYVILRPEFFAALIAALGRGSGWIQGIFSAVLVLLFASLAAACRSAEEDVFSGDDGRPGPLLDVRRRPNLFVKPVGYRGIEQIQDWGALVHGFPPCP